MAALAFVMLLRGISATPLPSGLEWRSVSTVSEISNAVQPLLHQSYVATPDDELRLDYTAADLRWMLSAPEALEDLRVAIGEPGSARWSDSSAQCHAQSYSRRAQTQRRGGVAAVRATRLAGPRADTPTACRAPPAEQQTTASGAHSTLPPSHHRDQQALLTASCFHRPPARSICCAAASAAAEMPGAVLPHHRQALLRAAVRDAARPFARLSAASTSMSVSMSMSFIG